MDTFQAILLSSTVSELGYMDTWIQIRLLVGVFKKESIRPRVRPSTIDGTERQCCIWALHYALEHVHAVAFVVAPVGCISSGRFGLRNDWLCHSTSVLGAQRRKKCFGRIRVISVV
jgi:hypothetical protein